MHWLGWAYVRCVLAVFTGPERSRRSILTTEESDRGITTIYFGMVEIVGQYGRNTIGDQSVRSEVFGEL